MQYTSRVCVKFVDEEKWNSFLDTFKIKSGNESVTLRDILFNKNFGYSLQFFANGVKKDAEALMFTIGDYWDDENLKNTCMMLHSAIGADAAIIGESYCYSVYPEVTFEMYSFGEQLHVDFRTRGASKHFSECPPEDMNKWLGATRKKLLSENEKAFLKRISK